MLPGVESVRVTCCALVYAPVGTEMVGVAIVIAAVPAVDGLPDPQAALNTKSIVAMINPKRDRKGNVLGGFCT